MFHHLVNMVRFLHGLCGYLVLVHILGIMEDIILKTLLRIPCVATAFLTILLKDFLVLGKIAVLIKSNISGINIENLICNKEIAENF